MPLDDIAFYRELLAENADLVSVRVHLAQALLAAGRLDEAVGEATEAIRANPSAPQAWLVRATAHKAQCAFAEAAADFQRAATLAPDRPMILVNLGISCAELNRLDDAEHWLRRAVELAPHSKEAHANLGSVLVRQGRLAEAEAPSLAALALDPGLVQAHQNLSGILDVTDPVAAGWHRDAAYGRQQIFVEPAPWPERSVLILSAAGAANVPLRHLLPRERTTLIHWYTEYAPAGQETELPPYDLVINGVGDPDLAPAITTAAAHVLAGHSVQVLNHPARVARTRRCDLPQLLANIPGVVVPLVLHHADSVEGLQARMRAGGLDFPVLVRAVGSHGGEGLQKVDDAAALADLSEAAGYVTQFVDFVSPDGWYRKYRAIFVDRRPYAYHLAISDRWLVHYWTAGMDRDAARRAEEAQFLADPVSVLGKAGMAALGMIAERLALDYAGIDFSVLADGRILVFEANATMLVHPEDNPIFTYRNAAVGIIQAAFTAMIEARAPRPFG